MLVVILRGSLVHDLSSTQSLAAGLTSEVPASTMTSNTSSTNSSSTESSTTTTLVRVSDVNHHKDKSDEVNYNPLDAGVLVEGGKSPYPTSL